MSNFSGLYGINLDHVIKMKDYSKTIDGKRENCVDVYLNDGSCKTFYTHSSNILNGCIKQVIPFDGYVAYEGDGQEVYCNRIWLVALTANNEFLPVETYDGYTSPENANNFIGIYKTIEDIKKQYPEYEIKEC